MTVRFVAGYNSGASYEAAKHETVLSIATEYWAMVWIDTIDDEATIMIRDTDANTIGADYVKAGFLAGETWHKGTANITIGARYQAGSPDDGFDGLLDNNRLYSGLFAVADFETLVNPSPPVLSNPILQGVILTGVSAP
jgi:hypothetical protein